MSVKELSIYLFLPILIGFSKGNIERGKTDILDVLLASDRYDPQIKPQIFNNTDTPTLVTISLHILSVSQIDDHRMLYTLELYFRQEWKDERLQYDNGTLGEYIMLNDQHRIWMPDIYFPNEHKSYFHDIIESNNFVKILPNGFIQNSARITLVLRCPMNFANFPFDKQICPLDIESYKWHADDIVLQWKNVTPVTVSNEVLNSLFSLERYWTEGGLLAYKSGEYSVLKLQLKFARQMKYFIIQIYIPCCMVFLVSCFAFWLNAKLMTARILLGTISLFSMAILIFNFNNGFPKAPYTRAIDVYTGIVLTFTFGALIETIMVHVSESRSSNKIQNTSETLKDDVEQNERILEKRNTIRQMKKWLYENHTSLNDIDAACRVLFPICFIIFLIIYSITCAALSN